MQVREHCSSLRAEMGLDGNQQHLQVANCKCGEEPPGNLAITSIECYCGLCVLCKVYMWGGSV